MSQYEKLDAAILKAIKDGNTRFHQIWPPLCDLAHPHIASRYGGVDRVVDRRLRALRKQHKITYYGGRWSVL